MGTDRFRGGALAKATLMGATGIHAAIDDGLLDIPFKVVGFETVFFDNMGNAIPLASAGANFSDRQREEFRKLYRNRRFYISHIRGCRSRRHHPNPAFGNGSYRRSESTVVFQI